MKEIGRILIVLVLLLVSVAAGSDARTGSGPPVRPRPSHWSVGFAQPDPRWLPGWAKESPLAEEGRGQGVFPKLENLRRVFAF